MKNWQWFLISFALMFVVVGPMRIPPLPFIFFVGPVMLVVFTYISFKYNFRESIALEPVPAKGYESRVAALEKDAADVSCLSFAKVDSFYLKMIPDCVVYVLKHESLPVYMHMYNMGSRKAFEYMTFFERDVELTTISNKNGGMIPRPPRKLTQVFEGKSPDLLLDEHLKAVSFINGKGIKARDVPYDTLKKDFMKRYLKVGEHVRKFSFWPVRLIYWTLTGRGKVHKRSIEEQYKLGMARLF